MPTTTKRTNADFRNDIHAAIRSGVEHIIHARADLGLVRAIADEVLAVNGTTASLGDAVNRAVTSYTGFLAVDGLVGAVVSRVAQVEQPALPEAEPGDFPHIFGLPDAAAIAWSDYDHQDHIALRQGHPGNGAWLLDGKRVTSESIVALLGDIRPAALDFRSNPQTIPSKVR